MGEFKTIMQAEIRVPQAGFTLADLKEHMKASKVPADARLRPAIVRDPVDPDRGGVEQDEVAFVAEWLT